jgi:hypothetical protein
MMLTSRALWFRLDLSARKALTRLFALILWTQIAPRFFMRGIDRAFAAAVALALIAGIFKEARVLIKEQRSYDARPIQCFVRVLARAALGVCTFMELLVAAAALCVSFR